MDFYKDLLVPKKMEFSKVFFRMCILALTATITVWSFLILKSLSAVIIIAVWYITWYVMRYFSIEHEYIVTNGELDVDIIYGKKKRKRLATINNKNLEIMAPLSSDKSLNGDFKKRIDASSGIKENKKYYAVFNHKEFGRTLLIFEPSDEMLENIKYYNRSKVTV